MTGPTETTTQRKQYPVSEAFARTAHIGSRAAYDKLCADAQNDYEGYWASLARQFVSWHKPFTKSLDESNAPFFQWFEDVFV